MVHLKHSAALLFCYSLVLNVENSCSAQHLRREESNQVYYDAEFGETLSQNRLLAGAAPVSNATSSNTIGINGTANNGSSTDGSSNNLSVVITYEQLCEFFL